MKTEKKDEIKEVSHTQSNVKNFIKAKLSSIDSKDMIPLKRVLNKEY